MKSYVNFVNGPWAGQCVEIDVDKLYFFVNDSYHQCVKYDIHKFVGARKEIRSVLFVACLGQLSPYDGTEAIMIAARKNIPYQRYEQYNCATV